MAGRGPEGGQRGGGGNRTNWCEHARLHFSTTARERRSRSGCGTQDRMPQVVIEAASADDRAAWLEVSAPAARSSTRVLLAATQWLGMARLWLGQTRMARHGMARRHGTARHGMAWRAAASSAVVHLVSRRIVCSARQDRDAVTRAVVAAACAWVGARSVVPQSLVRSQSLRFCADYYNSARYRDRVARQRVTI